MKTSVLLCDLRSLHNVGSFFRTADCAGFDRVYLTGFTPTPPRPEISKTALWADTYVPWEYHENVLALMDELIARGVRLIGLEQSDRSLDYRDFVPEADGEYCLVFGNEIDGVPQEVQDKCHAVLEIPMYGKKKSLNVSVTGAVLMFRMSEFRYPARQTVASGGEMR